MKIISMTMHRADIGKVVSNLAESRVDSDNPVH